MAEYSTENKRIVKNTAFLYIRMFIVLMISLYVTRVVFNSLGVVDFGIYNVVAGFVSLFSFLEATLSGSVQRFYNYFGTQEGEDGFNKIFSASIVISVLIAFVLFILFETFGIWYINNIMIIPEERLFSANIIFQFVIFSFFLTFIRMPFIGMIMAQEKMNFYAVVYIAEAFLKFGMALLLPWVQGDLLIAYGLSMFIISLIISVMMVVYVKRTSKFLRFSIHQDMDTFKSMLSFSGWNLVGTFVFMLKGEGINLLLNSFFGPIINAARGIAFQVNNAITGFSSNISIAFRPQVFNSYSLGDNSRCTRLMFLESKICYGMLCVLVVPLVLDVTYILEVWIGDTVPKNASNFTALVLIDALICSLNTPLTQVAHSVGKIKYYQIANSIVNIMLLPFSWLFLRLGFSPISVFVCTIVFSIMNQIVCLHELHKLYKYSSKEYLCEVIIPCFLMTLIVPIIPIVVHCSMSSSFLRLVLESVVSLIIGVYSAYYIILNDHEQVVVRNMIKKGI